MKTIQVVSPSKLEVVESVSRSLSSFEARVQVVVAGICGSDVKNIANPVQIPQVLGHEFSGRIIEVGKEVLSGFSIGDRVTAFPMIGCLECSECKERNFRDCNFKKTLGFQIPGAFAEEVIVDSRFLVSLPGFLSFEQGALVEHLSCGYRLVKEIENHISFDPKLHILIIGDGPIALANVQFLICRGYQNISLIGKHEVRKSFAKKLGIKKVYDCRECENDSFQLEGIDICIYSAKADETLEKTSIFLNKSALFFPQTRVVNKNIIEIIEKSSIKQARAFAYYIEDFTDVMGMIGRNEINTKSLITSRISLHEINKIIEQKSVNNKVVIINEQFY